MKTRLRTTRDAGTDLGGGRRAAGASQPGSDPSNFRRRWGWLAALRHAVVQRLAWNVGLHLYGIYARPIEASSGADPVVPGFHYHPYRAGEADDLLAAAKRPELGLTQAFIDKAFAKGDVCDAILCNGEIVSFSWSAFSPTHDHDDVYLEFDSRHRYGYFAFTLPEYRGRHLPRLFKPMRDRYCLARGCTRSIAYISIDNHSSIRSTIASGNRRIGFAGYLKHGQMFFAFRTPGVRESGFRFFLPDRRSH